MTCAAFEPTKRFRDDVRCLRAGDTITVFGEYSDKTLKLEKFSVNELDKTREENPYCSDCEKSMSSMGAEQGYRCSSCKQTKTEKVTVAVSRELSAGEWYEVPPVARRHLAEPIARINNRSESVT
jgi:tRNA(Ile2)-agmatinylcytidine synthase